MNQYVFSKVVAKFVDLIAALAFGLFFSQISIHCFHSASFISTRTILSNAAVILNFCLFTLRTQLHNFRSSLILYVLVLNKTKLLSMI